MLRPAATVLGWAVIVVVVLAIARGPAYELLAGAAADTPDLVRSLLNALPEVGLVTLAAVFAVVFVRARSRGLGQLSIGLVAAPATMLAYVLSELLKLIVSEQRPCRVLGSVETIAACPGVGDWSWPSNHAAIAGALATATVMLAPKAWRLVLPVAIAVAFARVAIGVHYVHDVLSGLLLGVFVVAVATVLLSPAAYRLVCRAAERPRLARILGPSRDRPPAA